jgi:hypothetical protein
MNLNIDIDNFSSPYSTPSDEKKESTFHLSLEGLPPMVKTSDVFRGDKGNPFLAPRGVWSVGEKLIVSDTGQNRVFIWNNFPETEFEAPDVILGQTELLHTGRNAGKETSASTLQYPSGIWSDGKILIIADAWNHRVLIWNEFPTNHGQEAYAVIGQPDFESNLTNHKGLGQIPQANTLNWPYGVFSDGKQLWICDTGNRRVLYFEQIPHTNFACADKVIGKLDFNDRDYENNDPIWPYSLRINEKGNLAITDTQFYRTLIWNNHQDAFTEKADVLIGQNDFDACGQNQYALFPSPCSLSWTYDSFFYKDGILVADTGNSRILWFPKVPTANAEMAENLIGHPRFIISSENSETRFGTDRQLYWPFSICTNGNKLILADTGNHRIIRFELNDFIA